MISQARRVIDRRYPTPGLGVHTRRPACERKILLDLVDMFLSCLVVVIGKAGNEMDQHEKYSVQVEREDALLFKLASDGSMAMRAIPLHEWEARVSRTAGRDAEAEAVRQIFLDDAEKDGRVLVGSHRTN